MRLPADLDSKLTRRRTVVKAVAVLLALSVLIASMVAPIFILMLTSGLSLQSEFPDDKSWLLILGCAFGAGAAYLTYRSVVIKAGGFDADEANRMWNGRRKNT
jgi:hypothetical protein